MYRELLKEFSLLYEMQIRKSNLLNQEDSSANRTLFAFHTGCPNQILRQSDVVRRNICCVTGHLNNQLALVVSSSTVDELQIRLEKTMARTLQLRV